MKDNILDTFSTWNKSPYKTVQVCLYQP